MANCNSAIFNAFTQNISPFSEIKIIDLLNYYNIVFTTVSLKKLTLIISNVQTYQLRVFSFRFVLFYTIEVGLPGNLLDNPNFAPAIGWDEDFVYNIITEPWQLIQPSARQYRLENTPQGKKDIFMTLCGKGTLTQSTVNSYT